MPEFDAELWSIETAPSKIVFAGDWHGNAAWGSTMIGYARDMGADTIIAAGDFGFTYSRNFMHSLRHALGRHQVNLYFVDGNHDHHELIWKGWELEPSGFMIPPMGLHRERMHYIPRGHRWKWWGLTFMGLGGAHSVDRPWRRLYVDWWPTELITESDIHRATAPEERVDVMITHDLFEDAPFPNDRKDKGWPDSELHMSRQNRLAVQSVVDRVKPRLFVHGHYHARYERTVVGVSGNPIKIVGLGMDGTSPEENLWIVDKDMLVPDDAHREAPEV